jgi:hypothetical protein
VTPSHQGDQRVSGAWVAARRTVRVVGSVVASILVAVAVVVWLMLGVVNGLR